MKTLKFRRKVVAGAMCVGLLLGTGNAFGANWLTLQGTEPAGAERLAKVWGFVQVQYQKDQSDPNGGRWLYSAKADCPGLGFPISF